MASKLLLEDICGDFVVDRSRAIVAESGSAGTSVFRIPGRFSVCNVKNANNRRYLRPVWEKNFREGSTLRQLMEKKAAFGLLEHPADGMVNLLSPISHIITKADLDGDEVNGELLIVDTAEGRKLKALIDAGYNPCVSSRGYGSVVRAADGVDEVQDDFVCEGWDVVFRPSFIQAELSPPRQPITTRAESTTESVVAPKPGYVKENQVSGANSSVSQQTTQNTTTMDPKLIRSTLAGLKPGQDKTPARYAESMERLAELHQDVANFLAEDAKRSWEANKLHAEITAVEDLWTNIQQAPSKTVKALTEEKTKILQVTKSITERAMELKKQLNEAIAKLNISREMNETTLSRGRKWRDRCCKFESQSKDLDFQLDVISMTLDNLVEKYNADVVALGRRVIEIELADKLNANPTLKESLAKATHPDEVGSIREQLTAGAKPTTESVTTPAPAAPAAPASTPAPINETTLPKPAVVHVASVERNPMNFTESVELTRRLSPVMAQ